MKLIQTPGLITGVILGASLITLSAASNDSALGGLNVFSPGTTVSSAEVNANFTMVIDEVTSLNTRISDIENNSHDSGLVFFEGPLGLTDSVSMEVTVPDGYGFRLNSGWAADNGGDAWHLRENSDIQMTVTNLDGILSRGSSNRWVGNVIPPGHTINFYWIDVWGQGTVFDKLYLEFEKVAYSL